MGDRTARKGQEAKTGAAKGSLSSGGGLGPAQQHNSVSAAQPVSALMGQVLTGGLSLLNAAP